MLCPTNRQTRREFLRASSATGLLAAVRTAFPHGAFAQGAGPEVKQIRLGYIALTDAAPLIIAKERGLFAKHGLTEPAVIKQPSWAAVRDNIAANGTPTAIDGAHILTPMPYLMHTGKAMPDGKPVPMAILLRLNINGQGISLDKSLLRTGTNLDAKPMKEIYEKATRWR